MTKQRMISDIEERIRRLQEDAIVSKLTTGRGRVIILLCYFGNRLPDAFVIIHAGTIIINVESGSRKRKSRGSEFILLEKRKKPVTVNDILTVYS